MQFAGLIFLVYLALPAILAEDVSYQACVDKYSRKGYQPWQEWSDHYTCHRYRCEIRDGKYFIAAVGCRKPKIPENALECHEYIEDENVEFPTCCARLRCVVEINGERTVQTRGQPGELFPDKPWKGQQNEPNPAVVGMGAIQQNTGGESQGQAAPGIFNSRGAGKHTDGSDINNRRYVDPYPNQQMQESPRKKRLADDAYPSDTMRMKMSAEDSKLSELMSSETLKMMPVDGPSNSTKILKQKRAADYIYPMLQIREKRAANPIFDRGLARQSAPYRAHQVKIHGYSPERYTAYFTNSVKGLTDPKLQYY